MVIIINFILFYMKIIREGKDMVKEKISVKYKVRRRGLLKRKKYTGAGF
jgi:hypothetical protein